MEVRRALKPASPIPLHAAVDLAEAGIETRQWWGKGCHRHLAFANSPRLPLPVTERLAASVVGLPFFPGLGEAEVVHVRDTINTMLSNYRKG